MNSLLIERLNSQRNSEMNLSDIAILLGYIGIYDLRIQVDELKVRAWAQSLDSDIELEEAKKIVSAHYANHDTAINPSHINREWRHRLASRRERERSQRMSLEYEEIEKRKASPEAVAKYMAEIRQILNRGNDASLETDNGQVASDS
jgi:hypothetical protein